MEAFRIVFMGTPDFAVGVLDTLLKENCTIVGVITAPDKPAGRGRKLNESAVKKYAVKKGLPVLQPTNLKSEAFLQELAALKANLQIIVAFRMLPKVVWNMPKYGTFNLHASLLPQYRGAAPINWAIMNGEKTTGVTTFFIDEKIDTGAVILQEETPIYRTDNAEDLHDRLMNIGAKLVHKTVIRLETGDFKTTLQAQHKHLKLAYKIHRETCQIDWSQSIDTIYNFIRGLSPYPAAWTTLENGQQTSTLKIYSAQVQEEEHQLAIGSILSSKKEMKVAVCGGFLNLLEIQLQGKKRMPVRDVLNGLELVKNAKMS